VYIWGLEIGEIFLFHLQDSVKFSPSLFDGFLLLGAFFFENISDSRSHCACMIHMRLGIVRPVKLLVILAIGHSNFLDLASVLVAHVFALFVLDAIVLLKSIDYRNLTRLRRTLRLVSRKGATNLESS